MFNFIQHPTVKGFLAVFEDAHESGELSSKYPPAEPGALGLEPLEAAGPCCINPHSYSHCAMPPQEPSVLLGHPYLTFW